MSEKPRNLLFLFTDEQRADTMAAYGNDKIETPNLNRLANESMVFEKCYVTQPVCTPSRSTIMTGLWPHQNGCMANNIPLPEHVRTIAEMLPDGKYATGYHGKWHLGDEIFPQHGFREWRAIDDGYRGYFRPDKDRHARSTYHQYLLSLGLKPADGEAFGRVEVARLPEECSKPAYLAQEASRFLRENKASPFILYVNFLEPHMPFTGPRDAQYDPMGDILPANFNAPPGRSGTLKARAFERFFRERWKLKTEEDWRRLIAKYWGLCSQVDTHVGTIFRTLEECGLMQDTIIVYTSDHGDMMGSHRLVAKCLMYEESVRVPFLLRVPGVLQGGRHAHPVSQIDLVPTLLDLLGERVPDGLPGRSLRPLWEGNEKPRDVFVEWNRGKQNNDFDSMLTKDPLPEWLTELATKEQLSAAMQDPVRTVVTPEGWKLNLSTVGDHELYNLHDDPLETDNLAKDLRQLGRMRELAERIYQWQQQVDDAVELPNLTSQ